MKVFKIAGLHFGRVVGLGGVLMVTLCSCSTAGTSADLQTYQLEKNKYVTVYLDGDVKFYGERSIRRDLSKESILEAAGGFAGLSVIKPKSVTVERGTASYRIRFDEMGKGKWKRFLLNDGDSVVVDRVLF